ALVPSGATLELIHHSIEGIADDDGQRVGAMLPGIVGDVANDGQVGRNEVVAGLPWLARNAGGNDQHIGPGAVRPARRTRYLGVCTAQRGRLLQVESFALGKL